MFYSQQQIRGLRISVLCFCLGIFLSQSMIASAKTDPMAQPGAQQGKALFQQNCAICHGAGATGGVGPNLLESPLVQNQKYYGNVVTLVIQEGRTSRGMPAFPTMTNANVSDILAFLHARIEIADSNGSSAAARGTELKRLLTGNAEAGKKYFYGEGKCSTCHSPTGDLAGIANKYQPEDLQSRFLYPRDNNVTATVSLPSGKNIKGKLLHLDAFYVAILDQSGGYRSWSLQKVKVQVEDPLSGHLDLLGKYKDKDVHDVFSYLETLK